MRALVVTNMYPSPEHPAFGSFVRDQVDALRRISGIEVEVFAFRGASGAGRYASAAQELRRVHGHERFDVVHAHFGLSAWPALAVSADRRAVTLHGTDLVHPRSRLISSAAFPFLDLVAAVSQPLLDAVPRWAIRRAITAVLPAGVDIRRFKPIARAEARAALGLAPDESYFLFPADPRRPEKRYDRARAVAGATRLLVLRDVEPSDVPLWVNAVNAVLVPSEREGFGIAALEALACDVPVLATPVGIAPTALEGIVGTLCEPFDAERWRAALEPHLAEADPRIEGRRSAERFSTDRMAAEVVAAWRSLS
jgi:glycosyltransferase involved in cell wall biosynthesis